MTSDVIGIDKIIGMPVLSRTSGDRLGEVYDLYIDPAQGLLMGVTIKAPNGKFGGVDYRQIYSFGSDAVMITDEGQIAVLDEAWVEHHPHAKKHLVGTNVLTESGNHLGRIADLFVRLTAPPLVIYELRGSLWDRLLGRNLFIYAASAGALSGNAERIIVPDAVVGSAASSLGELVAEPAAARRTA
ncbi:MAG: PRC-barrel domain-containing protein [Acidobacteria bacterium]|nr:PRC-barrel domain-containing protein [Acidobacteriota bacterium]